MPEKLTRQVEVLDIVEDPWPEGNGVEGAAVTFDGRFRVGAADQIIPDFYGQVGFGGRDDLMKRLEVPFVTVTETANG